MMIQSIERALPAWSPAPIKGVLISSSGILALANLSIISNRTALIGTSTWIDILVLVPGFYLQPEFDTPESSDIPSITNPNTKQYLKRIAGKFCSGEPLIFDISTSRSRRSYRERLVGRHGQILGDSNPPPYYVSDFLYAPVPLLTIAAIILMTLAQDWWGLGIILWLVTARALNIWVIRSRSAGLPSVSSKPPAHELWWVSLDEARYICLRGLNHDLEAFTQGIWMRRKSRVEECIEGTATIIVFLVAIFSDNMTQIGDIILVVLLLTSAGLLAMSNAYALTYSMNGRNAYPHQQSRSRDDGSITSKRDMDQTLSNEDGGETVISNSEQQEAKVASQSPRRSNDEINFV